MAGGGMATTRRVIRCNVNNLLLAVIVLESVFLGWYFLCWLTAAPAMAPLPDKVMNESVTKKMSKLPITVEKTGEDSDHWTADGLATCKFATGLVFFIIQLVALACLIIGYQRQNHKPLGIFLLWLILVSLFLIVVGIWLAVIADTWLPEELTTSGHKTLLTTRTKGSGSEGKVEVPDNAQKGPILEIAKRLANRINCFLIPLLVFKILTFLFELFAVVMSMQYFKSLAENKSEASEMKETQPKGEKEALVEKA